MTQKHTPEPWYVFSHYGDPEIRTKDSDKLVSAMLPSKIYDARRIVACVNACAGISTDSLEKGGVGSLLSLGLKEQKRGDVAEKQRDDLLVALQRAKQKMEAATQCHPAAIAHLLGESHEIIEAAIANVKGGTA